MPHLRHAHAETYTHLDIAIVDWHLLMITWHFELEAHELDAVSFTCSCMHARRIVFEK